MTTRSESRFVGVEALEDAVSAALPTPPTWEVRGEDMVLCAALAPGMRLEVVPLDGQRVQARVEGVLTRESLADWVERLRLPRLVDELRPSPRSAASPPVRGQVRPWSGRLAGASR